MALRPRSTHEPSLRPRRPFSPLIAPVVCVAGLALASLAAGCDKKGGSPEAEAHAQFASVCGRCHGAEGNGGPPAGAGAPAPRNFHDATFQSARSDEDLRQTIRQGKPPGMPAFGAMFSDEQLRGLVGVVRSFDPNRRSAAKPAEKNQ